MNEHTSAVTDAEPSTGTAHPEGDQAHSVHLAYEMVATNWTRQARAFVRSLHAYQNVGRLRARRLRRSTHDSGPGIQPLSVAAPPEIDTAPPPDAPAPTTARRPLTRRQFEIAGLIAQGLSNDEIANRLVLTPGTVGNHVGHILRRLGARNRAQVASWATQMVAPPPSEDARRS